MAKNIIKTIDLTKTYFVGDIEVHALKSINLSIEEGEFVAIMGASGSGKSTLMNMIGCLDTPTSGEYLLDGVNTSKLTKNEYAEIRNQKIGFVFQGFNLLPRTTALENVELPLMYDRQRRIKDPNKKAIEVLEHVGLGDRLTHEPNQLSGGQQQRVAVSRAIVGNPKMILADEPTGNLDSTHGDEVMNILTNLNESGTTIVMVTHSPTYAEYGNRIIHLFDGHVVTENMQEEFHV